MKSRSPSLRHRWAIIAFRFALPVATFAAGWYCAPKTVENDYATHVKTASEHNFKNSTLPSAAILAQAKTDLAAILKISDPIERKLKLYEFAASLDSGTLKALLADMAKEPSNSPDHEAWSYLTGRWAELDPKGALSWAQNLHNSRDKNISIGEIFDTWSAQNPAAALAAYVQLPSVGIFDFSLEIIIENMAKQNPQSALAALHNLPAKEQGGFIIYTEAYANTFSAWAKNDPTSAAAAALNLPPSSLRNTSLTGVAGTWAEQDSTAALAWANSLPAGSTRQSAVSAAIQAMSNQDPVAAAALAANLSSGATGYVIGGYNRNDLLQNIASNWANQDPSAALAWADQTLNGATYDSVTQTVLKQMGQTDPAAAAAALAQISDPSVINQSIPNLATAWAQQDVQSALTWAQSLPTTNDDVRQTALNNILNTWTDTDPAGAAAYLQQNLSTDPDFGQLAAQLATSWGNSDPQAALNWAQSLPAGAAQNTALVAAVTQLANVDPDTAWADAKQLTGTSQAQAISNVISAMANQDPDEAANALDNLPAGADLDTATTNVAQSWLRQDPDDASQWIATLPDGSARDGAVTQLVSTLSKTDPATAFDWATSISDPTMRNTQAVSIATQWAYHDPAAAATAAQTALNLPGLSSAEQDTLQKIAAKTFITP